MDVEVHVESVREVETKRGKTRSVVRDAEGREYTTFRPAIGQEAAKFEGRRAHIEFHEQERNGFQNVYLDAIAPAAGGSEPKAGTDPEESAWRTAVEAAPWVLGTNEPDRAVPAGALNPETLSSHRLGVIGPERNGVDLMTGIRHERGVDRAHRAAADDRNFCHACLLRPPERRSSAHSGSPA